MEKWLDKGKDWDPRVVNLGTAFKMYDTADSSGCHICLLSIGGFTNGNLCNLYKRNLCPVLGQRWKSRVFFCINCFSFAFSLKQLLNNTKVAYFGEAYSNPPSQGIIVLKCPVHAFTALSMLWIIWILPESWQVSFLVFNQIETFITCCSFMRILMGSWGRG